MLQTKCKDKIYSENISVLHRIDKGLLPDYIKNPFKKALIGFKNTIKKCISLDGQWAYMKNLPSHRKSRCHFTPHTSISSSLSTNACMPAALDTDTQLLIHWVGVGPWKVSFENGLWGILLCTMVDTQFPEFLQILVQSNQSSCPKIVTSRQFSVCHFLSITYFRQV